MSNEIKDLMNVSTYSNFEFQAVKKDVVDTKGNQHYVLTGRVKSTFLERVVYVIAALGITILSGFIGLFFTQVQELWKNALFSHRNVEVLATKDQKDQFVRYVPGTAKPEPAVLPKNESPSIPPSPAPSIRPDGPAPASTPSPAPAAAVSSPSADKTTVKRKTKEEVSNAIKSQPETFFKVGEECQDKEFILQLIKEGEFSTAILRSLVLSAGFNDREILLEILNQKHFQLGTIFYEFTNDEELRGRLTELLRLHDDKQLILAYVSNGYLENEMSDLVKERLSHNRELLIEMLASNPKLITKIDQNPEIAALLKEIDVVYAIYGKNPLICKFLTEYPALPADLPASDEMLGKLKEIILGVYSDKSRTLRVPGYFPHILRRDGDFLYQIFQKSADLPELNINKNPAFNDKERLIQYIKGNVHSVVSNINCIPAELRGDKEVLSALEKCPIRRGPIRFTD